MPGMNLAEVEAALVALQNLPTAKAEAAALAAQQTADALQAKADAASALAGDAQKQLADAEQRAAELAAAVNANKAPVPISTNAGVTSSSAATSSTWKPGAATKHAA